MTEPPNFVLPERLPYDHDKFVDRDAEVRLVIDKARRLANGKSEEKRVVIFHAARGSGKSWLLHEIKFQLTSKNPRIIVADVDLDEFRIESTNEAPEVVRLIIDRVRSLVSPRMRMLQPNEELDRYSAVLVDDVRDAGVVVLLFDHVNESLPDLLALLEDRCLLPLAVFPTVLIVLAGRGKKYIWKGPELRLKSEEIELSYFNPMLTLEQLRKQAPQSAIYADEIHGLSAGYPWSNYLLRTLPTARADALRQTTEALFGTKTRSLVRAHMEALCVLRSFDVNHMPVMFAAYFKQPSTEWPYSKCQDIRRQLTQELLARWDKNKEGYVLDPAMRAILENVLYEGDRAKWAELQCAAYCLYQQWASRYLQTADLWQAEADYHANRLKVAGYDAKNCNCPEEV